MSKKYVQVAKQYVRDHFPEIGGIEPTVSSATKEVTLYTFRKALKTSDGATISKLVRISINQEGKIIKVNVSKG